MGFLYFPEDKSTYIPAAITLLIFMVAAFITVYFIYKQSKKEEKAIDAKYKLNKNEKDK